MRRIEQLEPDHLGGHPDRSQFLPERLSPDIEEMLVPGPGVDPDRPQRPEGVGVPRHHPDRVEIQPALPHLGPHDPGARVEGQLDRPVVGLAENAAAAPSRPSKSPSAGLVKATLDRKSAHHFQMSPS